MIKFEIRSDSLGHENTDALRFSDNSSIRTLLANVEETVTVPAGAQFAVFQYDGAKLWVRADGAVQTVPTGDADTLTQELNPDVRFISGITTLRLISPSAGEAVVTFYG